MAPNPLDKRTTNGGKVVNRNKKRNFAKFNKQKKVNNRRGKANVEDLLKLKAHFDEIRGSA